MPNAWEWSMIAVAVVAATVGIVKVIRDDRMIHRLLKARQDRWNAYHKRRMARAKWEAYCREVSGRD